MKQGTFVLIKISIIFIYSISAGNVTMKRLSEIRSFLQFGNLFNRQIQLVSSGIMNSAVDFRAEHVFAHGARKLDGFQVLPLNVLLHVGFLSLVAARDAEILSR